MAGTKDNGFTEVTANGGDEWEEVTAESQLVFDTIGDEWDGIYLGMDQVGSKGMYQAHFEKDGEGFFTIAGYDLRQKLQKVPAKAHVKLRYESDQDTGQSKPMKVFKVWSKR